MSRTLTQATLQSIGQHIVLQGWIDTIRDHGNITFIELRDRSGRVQVVVNKKLAKVHPEDVIEVTGLVVERPTEMVNSEHPTGRIEVQVSGLKVLNACKELPFPLNTQGTEINEELRLKYRYLDLRRPKMNSILKLRSKYIQAMREYLFEREFVEVETPILTKSTKEGARDFIVPSRFQPGKFYALPQSPQQYKQLLMTAGIERYFQVAKCIRDEDLRADRGFEFTQLDLEMSFVGRDDVMTTVEGMVKHAVRAVGGKLKDESFPVYSYQEAMSKYGADKFDIRTPAEKEQGLLAFTWVVSFPFFKKVDKADVAEVRDGKSGWTFTHNPFSMPNPEHLEWHMQGENTGDIITQQYDLVCNGFEAGGGSIRAHQPEVLKQTFKIMGYTDQEIEDSIGHMLKAFELGTPPHGGIALGLDRHIMLLAGEHSIKESIAFPMTSTGRTAVMEGPSEVSEEQLKELGIQVRGLQNQTGATSVFAKIKAHLDSEKIEYKTFEHQPVFTSEEAARVRGVSLASGAKALVLKADDKPIMLVVSATDKLDTKAFKKLTGFKSVSFADKDLLLQVTTLTPGAVPPFGSLFNIPTYVDEKLTQQPEINFNAGSHTHSIAMKTTDYLEVEKPTIGSFTQ